MSSQDRIFKDKGAITMTRGQKGSGRIELARSHSRLAVRFAMCFAIAVVATGLLAGCGSETSQALSSEVQTMLQDRLEAMSAGDTQAVAECYATNAVLDNYADENKSMQGATAIADYYGGILKDYGMQWVADGELIQYDRYVIQPVSNLALDNPHATGASVHVLDIDANGQIAHEWIVGWLKP